MKIGIDISPIVYETGVSYYTKHLVHALLHLNKENEFVLFGGSLRKLAQLKKMAGNYHATKRLYPIPPTLTHILWNKLHIVPIDWLTGKIDVFHSSDWTQPPTKAFKVTTIHDLVPLRFPEISHPRIVSAHKARLTWVKKEVNKIIAVSTFTKEETVKLLDINPDRIVVIPEAPDPNIKPVSDTQVSEVLNKFNITGKYLLVVGADPRKNIPAIINAFAKIKNKIGLKLVIAGRAWGQLPKEEGIVTLGHTPRTDFNTLYSGAEALVYTSTYEGFGLPILEAMQAGCPVVTSNITSMPEVAGDAAVLVDPLDPSAIASGIEKVLSNRQHWIEKGIARAKEFSWEYTAKLTLRVYREALR